MNLEKFKFDSHNNEFFHQLHVLISSVHAYIEIYMRDKEYVGTLI